MILKSIQLKKDMLLCYLSYSIKKYYIIYESKIIIKKETVNNISFLNVPLCTRTTYALKFLIFYISFFINI